MVETENLSNIAGSKSQLENFLTGKVVKLIMGDYGKVCSEAFSFVETLYNILPASHIGNMYFSELLLGAPRSGQARFSEYDKPQIRMFEPTTVGTRRNFLALLLHETGHAFNEFLIKNNPFYYHSIEHIFTEHISPMAKMAVRGTADFPAIDYLDGRKSRIDYIAGCLSEFIAETYLSYVAQGEVLRNFTSSLEGRQREAWELVYNAFKEGFEGWEYK